jgi:hypothetical protein
MKGKTTIALRRFTLCAPPAMLIWYIVAAPAHARDSTATAQVKTRTPDKRCLL